MKNRRFSNRLGCQNKGQGDAVKMLQKFRTGWLRR